MSLLVQLCTAALSGGGATIGIQTAAGWFRERHNAKTGERAIDARLEETRGELTIDLVTLARAEVAEAKKELTELRLVAQDVVHLKENLAQRMMQLDEALDNIDSLLSAATPEEVDAARRRAAAYLRRIRPTIGDLRNAVQREESARRIAGDVDDRTP